MTATDRYNRFKIIVRKDGLSQIADSYHWQRLTIETDEKSPRPTVSSDLRLVILGPNRGVSRLCLYRRRLYVPA